MAGGSMVPRMATQVVWEERHGTRIPSLPVHTEKRYQEVASEDAFNIVVHSIVKAKTVEESIAAAKLASAITEQQMRARAAYMRSLRVPVITAGLVVAGVAV
ncbi:hypothetical protein F5144DRAFT_545369 [Chaetomium tenue]|uniref:Uncharacterized protein n=1 Tax=Chaetomium tenue TaxID=1854479 RepID=A0ACB7PNF4_9PEZI|nr:hypothetical protein F5144DRAFT_545369 [Chaetomium globosum]